MEDFTRFVPASDVPEHLEDVALGVLVRVDENGDVNTQSIWDDAMLGGDGESLCDAITKYVLEVLENHARAMRLTN